MYIMSSDPIENVYSDGDLTEIQLVIEGKTAATRENIDSLPDLMERGEIPNLLLLNHLYFSNRDLYQRVLNDERARQFYHFGFFPETFPLVYGNEISPTIKFPGGESLFGYSRKGTIAIIEHPEKQIVIKPLQRNRENTITQIAAEKGVGPEQFLSLQGFLSEELLHGDSFSRLHHCDHGDRTDSNTMMEIGRRMGIILDLLHQNNIFFNDTILCGEFGESHTKIPADPSKTKLYDFGMSVMIPDNMAELDTQSIFDIAIGFPPYSLLQGQELPPEEVQKIAREFYETCLSKNARNKWLNQDGVRVEQNLGLAKLQGMRDAAVKDFLKGFDETHVILK
ncbi:hypothetical protein A3C37_02165 [Candidatus Peribacteria bacterium RIFCSPHIGHO2_02_FULL_53_20]|nr:MAG: hypothetical protein A3C37_02165 [Candidatus Peribacteria bacterium RIFCSPHIGHO2_02_FULL_53_20]OGJ68239.1 MAG: hypothetical protein A3B61_03675 [Candidatus Peribacteria bacterium RIFCSPLOWO2_01_FULL_53_10]OGJ70234.1 MAG: hypothetical protein A3G69_02120 [Candidatus Peribacteria bacterium RIFCSPLOWO2_12_FULL_53_10]